MESAARHMDERACSANNSVAVTLEIHRALEHIERLVPAMPVQRRAGAFRALLQGNAKALGVHIGRKHLDLHTNNITLAKLGNGTGMMSDASLLVNYVYIDAEERRRFAQHGHEYLITQQQYVSYKDVVQNTSSFEINFFHCCKDLYWFLTTNYNYFDIINKKEKGMRLKK